MAMPSMAILAMATANMALLPFAIQPTYYGQTRSTCDGYACPGNTYYDYAMAVGISRARNH